MPRNKRAQRGNTTVGPTRSQIFNPMVFLEYNTKQSLYVIAVQDAKKGSRCMCEMAGLSQASRIISTAKINLKLSER